jgi:hypothetical protein
MFRVCWATVGLLLITAVVALAGGLAVDVSVAVGHSLASPPMVITGPVTAIEPTSATVAGVVSPNGVSTSWYVEYGRTTNFGLRTRSARAESGIASLGVSARLSGLKPGTTYHYRFVAASSAGVAHGLGGLLATLAPRRAVTISAAPSIVEFGQRITLFGTVSTRRADRTVTILAQRADHHSFVWAGTVLTQSEGTWSIAVMPQIGTAYKALCEGVASPTKSIGVRPAVSLQARSRQRFATHVAGARSFAGRKVQLQRLSAGRWLTIARQHLNASAVAVFHPSLPRGLSKLRVAMSVNQAGIGYLAGFSPVISYNRKR